jgi:hypothetical protein
LITKKKFDKKKIFGSSKERATNYVDVIKVAKYLEAMKYLGQDFGISAEQYATMQMYSNVYEAMIYFQEESPKVVLYRLNNELNTIMTTKTDSDDFKKYVLYAGHYPTLWTYLSKMELTSVDCLSKVADANKASDDCIGKPVYSSSLVFQVVTKGDSSNDRFVKVIYNGLNVTSKLKCAKDGYCALNDFLSAFVVKDLFESVDAYDRQCKNYDVNLGSKLIALAVACIIFGVIMLLVFIKLLRQKLKKD